MAAEESKLVSRHKEWFSLAVCCTIALVGLTTQVDKVKDTNQHTKWSVSALSIAVALAAIAVFAHLLKEKFIATHVEGGMSLVILGILCGALPTIMKPGHDLATNGVGGILNANLYFFSWGAFIMALMLYTKILRDVHDIGIGEGKSQRTITWSAFGASSLVAMAAAVRIFKSANCSDFDVEFCDRTSFAIALGTVCGVFTLLWVPFGSSLPTMADSVAGVFMLIVWCFGVGYITFGGLEKAPGFNLGNLYFATWISFLLACALCADGFAALAEKFCEKRDSMTGNKPAETKDEEPKVVEVDETGDHDDEEG